MSALARYLRAKMKEQGLTQSQLAGKAELSESALSYLLNNPDVLPKPDTLNKLAGALGVAEAQLTALTGYAIEGAPDLDERQARLSRLMQALPWLESGVEKWLQLPEDEQDDILNQIEYRLNRQTQKAQS
jgi:transcriptional regulator with XRE-family HTH domain